MALTQQELDDMFGTQQPQQPVNPFVDANSGDPFIFPVGGNGQDGFDWKTDGMVLNEDWAKQNPDKAQGKLIGLQWEDFLNRYAPIESDLLNRIQDFDFTEEARDAGNIVGSSFDRQIGGLGRNLSRFGLSPTQAQTDASEDVLQRQKALSVAGAENLTRRGMRDRNYQIMGQMASHGKGIASGALGAMGQAGDMAAQRKQIGDQADKANTQSMIGGAVSGALAGAEYGTIAGLPGMLVGGLLGGILGGI